MSSPESIRVNRRLAIPLAEIELRFSRSSGPGGQHAQKTRVVRKAGPLLRAVAQDERSQWRNRELATERLVEVLREALRVERRRVATAPTAAARERRLEQKRRRAATKRLRRAPDE